MQKPEYDDFWEILHGGCLMLFYSFRVQTVVMMTYLILDTVGVRRRAAAWTRAAALSMTSMTQMMHDKHVSTLAQSSARRPDPI